MDETTPPPAPNPESKSAEPTPSAPPDEGTGLAPNIAATICAALPLVGGIVFLVLEKKDAFVRFWAMQSLFFGGFFMGVSILIKVAIFILAFIPILGWLVGLLLLAALFAFMAGCCIVWVVSIIKAFSNVEWEIPYLGKLARKQLASGQPPVV